LINAKIHFPRWSEVYRRFKEHEYHDIVPPSDPTMRNTNDLEFTNIKRCHLHTIATRTPIMPCLEDIEWVIMNTYIDNRTILNDEGRCIAYYQLSELEKYCRLHQPEKYMITGFVEKFHRDNDIKKSLAS